MTPLEALNALAALKRHIDGTDSNGDGH